MPTGVNLQQGRQKAAQVLGVKELQLKLNSIMDAASGREAAAVSAGAGRAVLGALTSAARGVHVPHQVIEDLFMYTRQPSAFGARPDSVTVLVGLRKKGTHKPAAAYRTWRASKQVGAFPKDSRTKPRRGRLVIGGPTIGENLGTMWELGTTKMAARPWFRPTIQGIRSEVYQLMVAGYEAILAKYK